MPWMVRIDLMVDKLFMLEIDDCPSYLGGG